MLTLNEGEIYYEEMSNKNTYISLYKEGENHNNIYIQVNRKTFNKRGAGVKLENVKRLATDEEKAWLEHCIKEDKFVEYEEFMKVYKPQFIVGQWYKYNNHIGKFYSYDNGIFQVSEYIYKKRYFNSNSNWGSKGKDTERSLATIEEFQEFLPLDHPDKQLDIKQIQEECKRRFPIGCKFKCANTKNESILRQDEIVYEINDSYIYASGGQGCLYYKGKYAELIETLEMIIPEYVEYVNTLYKGTIVKVEDWCCGSYCKVIFYNGNKEQPFKHLVKTSTKSAYELQNLKQQPLTPEQCYNTEIEVGDEVEVVYPCSTSGNRKGYVGYVKRIFQGGLSDFGSCQVYEINGWCEHISALRLIKKANKNTITTTLNKKVDVSSPKVTDKITVPRINTTSYDTLVHINIETNTKSIKIPKLETNTPEIKKIKIQSLTLTI